MWDMIWGTIKPLRDDLQFFLHFAVIYAVSKFNAIYTQKKKERRPLANFFPALLCTAFLGLGLHVLKWDLPMSIKVFIDVIVGYTSHEFIKRFSAVAILNFITNLLMGYVQFALKSRGLTIDERGVVSPIEKEKEDKKEGETTDENDQRGQDTIKDVSDSGFVADKPSKEEARGFRRSNKR